MAGMVLILGSGALLGLSSSKPNTQPEKAAAAAGDSVWIYQKDGTQSCGMGAGKTIEQAQRELQGAKVTVLEAKKGDDGQPMIQMCGATTGSFNAYRIPQKDFAAAQKLGFLKLEPTSP